MNPADAAATDTTTTGVTLAFAEDVAAASIAEVLDDVAARYDAVRIEDRGDETEGVLGFVAGGGTAFLIARREDVAFVDGRPDLAMTLGREVRAVLRLDVMLRRSQPDAFAPADAALVSAADALLARASGVVLDDLGNVYDPEELAALAAAKLPRALAFSYQLAAARRGAAGLPADVVPPPRPLPGRGADAAAHPLDLHVTGPHVPLAVLAQTALALATGTSVRMTAPRIEASEGLRLAALGVDLSLAEEAEPLPPPGLVEIFASHLTRDAAVAVLASVAGSLDLAGASGVWGLDRPAERAGGAPEKLATLATHDGTLDVVYVDLASAPGVVRAFVLARRDLVMLTGGAIGAAIAIEAGAAKSGALAATGVRIADAFTRATGGVAVDAAGVVYGGDELRRLASRGLDLDASWSRRLAANRAAIGVRLPVRERGS